MNEQRKFPRADKILPIKLSSPDYDILTETKNISASGVYCSVNKLLTVMTKLSLVILLPIKKNNKKIIKKINCCGIVVRNGVNDNNAQHPFKAAIYFINLKTQDTKTLSSYIKSLLNN